MKTVFFLKKELFFQKIFIFKNFVKDRLSKQLSVILWTQLNFVENSSNSNAFHTVLV